MIQCGFYRFIPNKDHRSCLARIYINVWGYKWVDFYNPNNGDQLNRSATTILAKVALEYGRFVPIVMQ